MSSVLHSQRRDSCLLIFADKRVIIMNDQNGEEEEELKGDEHRGLRSPPLFWPIQLSCSHPSRCRCHSLNPEITKRQVISETSKKKLKRSNSNILLFQS